MRQQSTNAGIIDEADARLARRVAPHDKLERRPAAEQNCKIVIAGHGHVPVPDRRGKAVGKAKDPRSTIEEVFQQFGVALADEGREPAQKNMAMAKLGGAASLPARERIFCGARWRGGV